MNVFQAHNPETIEILNDRGVLLEDPDTNMEAFRKAIRNVMVHQPQSLLFLVAAGGDEEIGGYLIAYDGPDTFSVFVYQVWADPQWSSEISEKFFHRLTEWAESRGRSEIRMETTRDPRAFNRKWGFEVASTVMKYQIEEPGNAELETKSDRPLGRASTSPGRPVESDDRSDDLSGSEPGSPAESGDATSSGDLVRVEPLDPLNPTGAGVS